MEALLKSKPDNRITRIWAGLSLGWRVLQLRRLLPKQQTVVVKSTLDVSNLMAWVATRRMPNAKLVWRMQRSDAIENKEDTLAHTLCRWVSGSVPLMVVNSTAGKSYYESDGFHCQRQVVIHNGVDTDRFRPDPKAGQMTRAGWGIDEHKKVIGFVGRIDPVKGHPLFLRAASALCSGKDDLHFVVVGDGPEGYKRELHQLARALSLDRHLTWTGERPDMPSVYNAFDALVSASHTEGLSNVIAEAMACGVPCVATNVGDSARVLGPSGVVVPPGSVEELVGGVKWVLDLSSKDRADLSASARQRIEDQFSDQWLLQQTEEALRSLI